MSAAAIEITGLCVRAGSLTLVRDLDLRIDDGRSLTIMGESGAGKSIVARAIVGVLPDGVRASGELAVGGRTRELGTRPRDFAGVAYLPQEPVAALDPLMTAADHIIEGYRGMTSRAARARARAALETFGIERAADLYPFMLSGGMAQRVAIAAALASGARIIVADEPTKGLDAAQRDRAIALLRKLLERGCSLLTITHDFTVARALGGELVVMHEGEIVERGEPARVLDDPRNRQTQRLVRAEPSNWPAFPAPVHGSPLIEFRAAGKRYGTTRVFENVNFTVGAGARISVYGPSGCGKTTLGNAALGLTALESGSVWRRPGLQVPALQKLYQDPPSAFAPSATMRRLLDDLTQRRRITFGRIDTLLDGLSLDRRLLDRRADQLSGGELQRFSLLRVLLVAPAFIFADEPTSRLDPFTQEQVIRALVDHAARHECALLFVTHDAAIARALSGSNVIALAERTPQSAAPGGAGSTS